MFITHKVFLKWLLYIVIVSFGASALTFFGIPQLTFAYDHIYLGTVLFLMYIAAEVLAARQAVRISRENVIADRLARWLHEHHGGVERVSINRFNRVQIVTESDRIELDDSFLADHLRNLIAKANLATNHTLTQRILLDGLADKVYFQTLIGDFISARIVWIGILATILGVIMAFWPFVGLDGLNIEAIRQNLGPFFRGVAVAFLPTAVSFVCKIALDFNTRIITAGANELLDSITTIGEAFVVPLLEQQQRQAANNAELRKYGLTVETQ